MKAREMTKASAKLPSEDAQPPADAAGGRLRRIERRLAAALALDIVNYSLMIGHDDEGTHQRVGKAFARVNQMVRRFEGNVISFSGDGLMAVFPSSRAALKCGIDMQRERRHRNMKLAPEKRIVFRVGIHVGELVFQGWRASGDALNIAARLERICQPGEICISATLLDQAEQAPGISLDSMGARKLKNIRQPVQIYRVTLAGPAKGGVPDTSMPDQWNTRPICGREPSIALLPFGYVGGSAGDAYFAEDILEGIVASLSDLKELIVIARSSKSANSDRNLYVREIGQALGVSYVLSGSVRRSTTTTRVTAELCYAENGVVIWADTTEVLLGERFDLQNRIAQRIVAGVRPYLYNERLSRASRRRAEILTADDRTPPHQVEQLEVP
jgi:adenylate cyclase